MKFIIKERYNSKVGTLLLYEGQSQNSINRNSVVPLLKIQFNFLYLVQLRIFWKWLNKCRKVKIKYNSKKKGGFATGDIV
jgi:hypothetical protein